MVDVIVAGTGPAAAVAALVLARAGVRVLMVTPETDPRDGHGVALLTAAAVTALERLGLTAPAAAGRRLDGWRLGLPHASLRRMHIGERHGPVALSRRDLQTWLIDVATRAGARVETGWHVRAPLVDQSTGSVRGVIIRRRHPAEAVRMPAHVVIAADESRSALLRRLGTHASSMRGRRVCEARISGITDMTGSVEIHLASRSYCRVTPQDRDVADVRFVSERRTRSSAGVMDLLARHEHLASRVTGARVMAGPWTTRLGDARAGPIDVPGLLMTGDGLDDRWGDDDLAVSVADGHGTADVAIERLEAGSGSDVIVGREPVLDARFDAWRRGRGRRDWMLRHGWSVHAAGIASRVVPRLVTRLLLHEPFT